MQVLGAKEKRGEKMCQLGFEWKKNREAQGNINVFGTMFLGWVQIKTVVQEENASQSCPKPGF